MGPDAGQSTGPGPWLVVCGHSNLDLQLDVASLPARGDSVQVSERRTVWGGTAANIARHAAGLGVGTRLWSRIGPDFPADWRAALAASGVDLAFDMDGGSRTPACTILTAPDGAQAYAMDQGAMADMARHPPPASLLDDMPKGGWLHLATGDPAAYGRLPAAAQAGGVRVALDPGQELRTLYDTRSFERLLDRSDAFWCNEHELDIALRFLSYGDPVQLLDHVARVIVTRGATGASLYGAGKPVHVSAHAVHVVDPTGGGDAARAGWYAALAQGSDEHTALRWAMAAAAVVVGWVGPQPRALDRALVERLLRQG